LKNIIKNNFQNHGLILKKMGQF